MISEQLWPSSITGKKDWKQSQDLGLVETWPGARHPRRAWEGWQGDGCVITQWVFVQISEIQGNQSWRRPTPHLRGESVMDREPMAAGTSGSASAVIS